MGITTKPLLIALASVTLLLVASGYLLRAEMQEHAQTQVLLKVSEETLQGFVAAIDLMTTDQIIVSNKLTNTQNEYSTIVRDLNKLKDREATVLAKKGLVTLKINKAYNKQQLRLACITGDIPACGK